MTNKQNGEQSTPSAQVREVLGRYPNTLVFSTKQSQKAEVINQISCNLTQTSILHTQQSPVVSQLMFVNQTTAPFALPRGPEATVTTVTLKCHV